MLKLAELYEILKNEYNSGIFSLDTENERIGWIYKSQGVNNYREAEDRWLSFLGAKLTAEAIISGTDYRMIQQFEINNRIGFFITHKDNLPNVKKH